MVEVQRSRIVAAAIAVVEEHGYQRLTVGRILERARVSRKTFYALFRSAEDCFLAAFEFALAQAREIATAAYSSESDWRSGMRAATFSLLTFMDQEPAQTWLCVVEALAGERPVLDFRATALEEVARAIDNGRAQADSSHRPHPLVAHGIAAAIAGVLHRRLLDEQDDSSLTELLGPLMSMIVMPYRGGEIANEELNAPLPDVPVYPIHKRSRRAANPLAGIQMRLTYRTVRVLMVIAETPDASNREVAAGAGIVDQGQMSKLLTRLEGLGLIENFAPGQARRTVNAWRLTRLGAQVQRATQGL